MDLGPRTGETVGRMAGRIGGARRDRERGTSQVRVGPNLGSCPLDLGTRNRRLYLSAQCLQVSKCPWPRTRLALPAPLGQRETPAPPLPRAKGGLRRPERVQAPPREKTPPLPSLHAQGRPFTYRGWARADFRFRPTQAPPRPRPAPQSC